MTILLNVDGSWDVAPVEPVCIGPTWQRFRTWTPENQVYVLPDHVGIETLGWGAIQWITANLRDPDRTDFEGEPMSWIPTAEQARFILWWYAIDHNGRFMYRRGILQRLKGWGRARTRSPPRWPASSCSGRAGSTTGSSRTAPSPICGKTAPHRSARRMPPRTSRSPQSPRSRPTTPCRCSPR